MAVTDLTGPVRTRQERDRRRKRHRLVALVIVVVLVVAAVWAVVFSPLLATREVRVEGTSLLDPALVVETAQVPLGTPLVRQDLSAAEQRVLGMAPVREVEATRSWPHAVHLRVRERTPALAVPAGSAFTLADAEGVSYARVPDKPEDIVATEGPVEDGSLVSAMARTVGALPPDLREQVVTVRAESPSDVHLVLEDGRTLVWGGPEDSELKGEVARVLLETVDTATVYDVSAPSFPVTR